MHHAFCSIGVSFKIQRKTIKGQNTRLEHVIRIAHTLKSSSLRKRDSAPIQMVKNGGWVGGCLGRSREIFYHVIGIIFEIRSNEVMTIA